MALSDEVKSRYATQYLVEITNPRDPTATDIDDPHLDAASNDVIGEFKTHVGKDFDLTKTQHISVAVDAVVAKLLSRSGQKGDLARGLIDDYIARMKELAKVEGRDRILPQRTTRPLVAGAEKDKAFADDVWDAIEPDPPTHSNVFSDDTD